MRAKDFWRQLKKRKLIRVALVYLFIALLALLFGVFAFDWLGMPQWLATSLIVLGLLGLPVALVLAWFYEITPQGIRKDTTGHIESSNQYEDPVETTPSVAILPFIDLSDTGAHSSYCEGLAEEILDALRKVPNIRVASRMTAFHLNSQNINARDVGKKLNVQLELKGSVLKSEDKLRVEVELVDTTDGTQLWSHKFNKPLESIFDIQEKIFNAITRTLQVPARFTDVVTPYEVSPKAYDLFLHGLSCFAKHTTQDNVYARQLFKQTIDLEPGFGRAWAALAYTYGYSYMYFNATDVNLVEAKRTSSQALRLAPDLAESHVSAGIAYCMNQSYKKAEVEFEKAVELDPKNFRAWYFFGRAKVQEGDLERALKLFDRASRVRPEDFQSVLLQAQLYTSLGMGGEAMEVTRLGIKRVRAVLELIPNDNRALNMGAFALLRLGQVEEAKRWMLTSMKNAPMDSIIQYNGACFFSLAGEAQQALDCLENCLIKVGNISREWLEHDSDMDNIRHYPRYEQIIAHFPD